jgi:hypothetical protein
MYKKIIFPPVPVPYDTSFVMDTREYICIRTCLSCLCVCAGVPVLHVRGHVLLLAPHAQAVPPHAPPQTGTGKITS